MPPWKSACMSKCVAKNVLPLHRGISTASARGSMRGIRQGPRVIRRAVGFRPSVRPGCGLRPVRRKPGIAVRRKGYGGRTWECTGVRRGDSHERARRIRVQERDRAGWHREHGAPHRADGAGRGWPHRRRRPGGRGGRSHRRANSTWVGRICCPALSTCMSICAGRAAPQAPAMRAPS